MKSGTFRVTPDYLACHDTHVNLDLWYGRRGRYTAYVYVIGRTMTLCVAELGVPGPIIWSRLHDVDGMTILDDLKNAIDLLYWDGVANAPLGTKGALS